MSLQFNDTTNFKGLVQMYEKEIGATRGTVSSNTNLLKEFTADANLAIDDYITIAIQSSGKWKIDDSNHTKYPEITADLSTTARDYEFITDEQGNRILDIYKVYAKETGGAYKLLTAYDADTEAQSSSFTDGLNATGVPSKYDKYANSIVLDVFPSTNVTDGLKVSINREGSYFTYDATTKKAGFPGTHHKFFYLKPALDYARRNSITSYQLIESEVIKLEREIKEYFDRRAKDEPQRLSIAYQDNR